LSVGRLRPNAVLATAYDLKVFFATVAKSPEQVSDVRAFTSGHARDGC
jgi:hypothetical protein